MGTRKADTRMCSALHTAWTAKQGKKPPLPGRVTELRIAIRALTLIAIIPSAALADEVSFSQDVRPLLQRKCAVCHQGAGAQQGLRIGTVEDLLRGGKSGPAVVRGRPEASLLMTMTDGESPTMPPVGEALTESELNTIRAWILSGALDEGQAETAVANVVWWSLTPLGDPSPPAVDRNWERSAIDGFLLSTMREKGLTPSEEADRGSLIRRLSFDLRGLPPSLDEIRDFVHASDPDAYERLVDRMLSSPAYGERWGRHWLDVVRFGESNGYEQNHLRANAWPYRDWVIRSLNEDKPFDRMIVEQIAGDQVAPDDPQVQAATGFLVAGPHDTVRIQNPAGEAQKRANHLDDMVMGTASAFLGLTVHCARCHDHKFDPIRTEDYYRLQAAFAGTWHGERTWDSPARVQSFNAATAPLSEVIRESETELQALKDSARSRVDSRREEILRAYRPRVDSTGTVEVFEPVKARFIRLTVTKATASRRQVDLDEFEVWTAGNSTRNVALEGRVSAGGTRVDSASPETYSPRNLVDGKYDQRWISAGTFPVWIQVELPKTATIGRVEWSSDRLGGFGGRFGRPQPESYTVDLSSDGASWTTVATSAGRLPFTEDEQERLLLDAVFSPAEKQAWTRIEARKRNAERARNQLSRPRTAFLGRFEQPAEPSYVMVRGDPMNKGAGVAPGSLSTLSGMLDPFELPPDAPEGERRLALARWIASDQNALTARVIVNRVWMYHFGEPLVRNPSDFGLNGGRPSHPELLDWLASRLIHTHQWHLKPLHRDIVTSSGYRQSSRFREAASRIDKDGSLLWRFSPRRLDAEEIRDAILSASGNLNRTMGGPGFRLYRYTVDNVATYYPLDEFSPETFRRSVYHQHARSVKPDLLGEFDCPETSLPAPRRTATTSPLQALSLLNNQFVLGQASSFAARVESASNETDADRVRRAWRHALGRDPTEPELVAASDFVAAEGLAALARALLNSNEFLYVF